VISPRFSEAVLRGFLNRATTTTSTFRGKSAYVHVGTQAGATPLPIASSTCGTSDNLTQSTSPNLCYTYGDYLAPTSRYSVPLAQSCATGTQSTLETFATSPISGPTSATEGTSGPSVSIVYDSR
jgi:hypothetical protein